jgi:hypothetical protein
MGEHMPTNRNLIPSEAEINKVAETRNCSALKNPPLDPRMTLHKGVGDIVSFPFLPHC